jgi:hypothetical protein
MLFGETQRRSKIGLEPQRVHQKQTRYNYLQIPGTFHTAGKLKTRSFRKGNKMKRIANTEKFP